MKNDARKTARHPEPARHVPLPSRQHRKHPSPLFKLPNKIDWSVFEKELGALFVEKVGRPGLPISLLVGLQYLRHAYRESDESVVEKFLKNPYWQYFCGFEYFQHHFPLDPSIMVRWRKRVGPKGMEKLFKETIAAVQRENFLHRSDVSPAIVDTTVQEKVIVFPTDARMYHKARRMLVRAVVRGKGFCFGRATSC